MLTFLKAIHINSRPRRRTFSSSEIPLIRSTPHVLTPKEVSELLQLGNRLNYGDISDWYSLSANAIEENAVLAPTFAAFGFSPSKLLASAFPQHEWLPWKFKKRSRGMWESEGHRRAFFDWLQRDMGFVRSPSCCCLT